MENNCSVLYPYESETRIVVDLSGIWKFKLDQDDNGIDLKWYLGLKDATTIPVPASFADLFTCKIVREFCGNIWYERDVYIPNEWKEKTINIRFFSATHYATVWMNGIELGSHNGGYTPFVFNLNQAIKFGQKNKIVVAVNNELSPKTLPVGSSRRLASGRKMNFPSYDFYNYSGLQRPVKLLVLPKETIIDIDVLTDIDNDDGIVKYEVKTNGNNQVVVSVETEDGKPVTDKVSNKSGEFIIKNAKFWEPEEGNLYVLAVSIVDHNNNLIDKYNLPFGIRTVKVVGTNFLINNKPFYFKGFGKHEDSELYGHGFNPIVIKRDFELIKWIGANSFRTSHYPYSEEIMQAADREGIVVIDEVAAVGMFAVNTILNPGGTSNKDYFSQPDVHSITKKSHLQAVSELIQRDKNHPCVVMWSLANEPDTTKDYCFTYFSTIFEHARKIDKQNLPKTIVGVQSSGYDVCKCKQLYDVYCLNRYYGWYSEPGNQFEEGLILLKDELKKWEQDHKPVLFTEFGCDTLPYVHKLPSVMWSEEYYLEYMIAYFKIFDQFEAVKGEQLWNFADFQTVEGIMRVNGNNKGIFTRNRQPKMIAHAIRNRWTKLPNNYKSK